MTVTPSERRVRMSDRYQRTYLKQFALKVSCGQAKHVYSVTLVHDDIDILQTAKLQNIIEIYIVKHLAVCLNDKYSIVIHLVNNTC